MTTKSPQASSSSRMISWLLIALVILLIIMAALLYYSLRDAAKVVSQIKAQTSTATATSAFRPTTTPKFSATPEPSPTLIPPPCNLAAITPLSIIPGDGVLTANSVFTSTWRLDNIGSCAWNGDYALNFVSGDVMDGPGKALLKQVVDAGESITLTLTFRAPATSGDYLAQYDFISDQEEPIASDIQVAIRVLAETVIFDGAADPCGLFTWVSAVGPLACPSDDALRGSVTISDTTILVRPNSGPDAIIQGTTITLTLQTGEHFQAFFGCPPTNTVCNVLFALGYLAADGSQVTLKEWSVQNSDLRMVDVDLSGFAGQETALVLSVRSFEEVPAGNAFAWVQPRIVRYE